MEKSSNNRPSKRLSRPRKKMHMADKNPMMQEQGIGVGTGDLPACTSESNFIFNFAYGMDYELNSTTVTTMCQMMPNYIDTLQQLNGAEAVNFTQTCCNEVLGNVAGSPEGGPSPEIGGGNAETTVMTSFGADDAVADDPAMEDYPCNASHPLAPQVEDYPGGGTDPDYLQAKGAFLRKCKDSKRKKMKQKKAPALGRKGKVRGPRKSMGPQRRIQESFIKRFKKLANINSKKNG